MIEFEINDKNIKHALIIGIGNGACNALNYIYLNNTFDQIDFLAINTDKQALSNLNIPQNRQLLIGERLTKGKSTDGNTEIGRACAIDSIEEIKEFTTINYKTVFILAGMGGGTGTGATPVIAELFLNLGYIVVTIVSSPGILEGQLSKENIKHRVEILSKSSDVVFMFSNDRISAMHNENSISEILNHANSVFKMPIDIIMEMVTPYGDGNINYDDVKELIQGVNGLAVAISGSSKGVNRIEKALKEMYNSPYLSNAKLKSANKMLLFFEWRSEDEIEMPEMGEVVDSILENMRDDSTITWETRINALQKTEIKINAIFTVEPEY